MKSQDPKLTKYDPGYLEMRQCKHVIRVGTLKFICTKKLGHLDEHFGSVYWENDSEEAITIRSFPADQRERAAAEMCPSKIPSQAVAEVMRGAEAMREP